MDAFKKVVWQEGMFIAPQHFQQQDRYVQNYIRQNIETLAGFAPFFGITELVLNHDLLKIGKLSIPSCSGVFPDGTPGLILLAAITEQIEIDALDQADLPRLPADLIMDSPATLFD